MLTNTLFCLFQYFISVVIIFAIEIAAGVIAFIYRDRVRTFCSLLKHVTVDFFDFVHVLHFV